jgi:hypothetical protein
MYPGLAAPTDDEQNGDGIYLGIYQRGDRVHGVPQPAVLHIDHCSLAGRQMIARRERDSVTLIRSYDVPVAYAQRKHQLVAKPFELRIRDSGVEGETRASRAPQGKRLRQPWLIRSQG